jgi:hypothetical protein
MYLGRIRGLYRGHDESTGRSSICGRRRYNPTTVIHELADVIEVARGVWGAEHVIDPGDVIDQVGYLTLVR